MTEDINQPATELPVEDERTVLKERADKLGIKYSKNVKTDVLARMIEDKLEESKAQSETTQSKNSLRTQQRLELTKLIRIKLTCLNPNKQSWPGEIITVSNDVIGAQKKYVPYDQKFYEKGYHVPNFIYMALKERKYLSMHTIKDSQGHEIVRRELKPEFTIEVLPPLTKEELKQLADDQRRTDRLKDE